MEQQLGALPRRHLVVDLVIRITGRMWYVIGGPFAPPCGAALFARAIVDIESIPAHAAPAVPEAT